MEHLTNNTPATDAGNSSTSIDTSDATKTERARKWLRLFDEYTQGAYDTANDDQQCLEGLLHRAAPLAIAAAQEAGMLSRFPFEASKAGANEGVGEMHDRKRCLANLLASHMTPRTFGDEHADALNEIRPILDFCALHLLQAQTARFADELREPYWYERGDEEAATQTNYHALFGMYLEHSGKRAQFEAERLSFGDVIETQTGAGTPEMEDALRQLAYIAGERAADNILDCVAVDAQEILATRAVFAQVRGGLDALESDFEGAVNQHRTYLEAQLETLEEVNA